MLIAHKPPVWPQFGPFLLKTHVLECKHSLKQKLLYLNKILYIIKNHVVYDVLFTLLASLVNETNFKRIQNKCGVFAILSMI